MLRVNWDSPEAEGRASRTYDPWDDDDMIGRPKLKVYRGYTPMQRRLGVPRMLWCAWVVRMIWNLVVSKVKGRV